MEALLRRYAVDGLVAVSDDVPAGRGMVLKADVLPNSIIFHIPGPSLLNPLTAARYMHVDLLPSPSRPSVRQGIELDVSDAEVPAFGRVQDASRSNPAQLPLSSSQALALLLTLWRRQVQRGSGLPVKPAEPIPDGLSAFARTLPADFDTVPLLWSLYASDKVSSEDARMCRALVESLPWHSAQRLLDVRKRFGGDARAVFAVLALEPSLLPQWASHVSPSELDEDQILDHFYWAWMCVNSRCLYLPIGLKTHADNFTMAPVIDLINHTFDKAMECKVEYPPEGGMQIRAPRSDPKAFNVKSVTHPDDGSVQQVEEWQRGCRAGDELFITYGPHSNEFLLSEYGFTLPIMDPKDPTMLHLSQNPYADVVVDNIVLSLLSSQSSLLQAELKRELLHERGYWLDWTIHPTGEPSHRLVCALRLLALDVAPSREKEDVGATIAALAHKGSKRLRLQQQQPQYTQQPGSSKELQRHQNAESGKKAAASTTSASEDMASIADWEAMVIGSKEIVSEANEDRARQILLEICRLVLERSNNSRTALERTFSTREGTATPAGPSDAAAGSEQASQRWTQSFHIVRHLLLEQAQIARLVSEATTIQTEPW